MGKESYTQDRALAVGLAAALGAPLVWSSAGLVIKEVDLPPIEVALMRGSFSALFFLVLAAWTDGYRLRLRSAAAWGAAFSVAATVTLFVLATRWTTAAAAICLQSTAPAWIAVIEWMLYAQRPGRGDLLSVAGCTVGMALFFAGRLDNTAFLGNVLGLAAGVFFGLHMLLMRRVDRDDLLPVQGVGNLMAAAMSVLLGLSGLGQLAGDGAPWLVMPSLPQWEAVAYLGIGQIGFGYLLFNTAIQRLPALDVSLFALLEPLLNPIWVYLGHGEHPGPWAITGGLLVVGTLATHTAWHWRTAYSACVRSEK